MRYHNYKSATHPIHDDIGPIISAFRHGHAHIAQIRFNRLIDRLDLKRGESVIVRNLIREKVKLQ